MEGRRSGSSRAMNRHRGDRNSNVGDTFQRIVREKNSRVVSSRPISDILVVKTRSGGKVGFHKRMVESASEAVNITHHASWAMEDLKVVP